MRSLSAILLGATLVATACVGQQQPGTSPAPTGTGGGATATASPEPAAKRGGRVVAGVGERLVSLSPVLGFDFISSAIWSKFYRPLLTEDPESGELVGELAERFTRSDDRKTITFTLRSGLKWSDGQPVTGEDYRYTAEALARSKASQFQTFFSTVQGFPEYVEGKADKISGIAVSGDGRTITVTRTIANCVGLRELGLVPSGVLPRHHFVTAWNNTTTDASTNIDTHPLNNAPPASVGPFVFKEYQSDVQVVMTRNDSYFRGAPLLDEFIVKIYAGPQALKAALLTGEVTYATNVPAGDVEEIRQTGRELNYHRVQTPTDNNFIGWNKTSTSAPWLAVKEVRQALWYGFNVDVALQAVMQGLATQTYTHTAPSFWSYPPNGAGLNKYAYDPAKAKQLLEQAGAKMGPDGVYQWTDGSPMVLKMDGVGGGAPPGQVIEIMQEQYKQIGITVEPNLLSFPAFVGRTTGKAPDRGGTFWGFQPAGPEGEPTWPFYHSQGPANFFNYSNPEADAAIITGRDGPDCEMGARAQAYAKFNQVLNQDAANLYLWMRDFIAFSSAKLEGFEPKPFDLHSEWNIEKWSLE